MDADPPRRAWLRWAAPAAIGVLLLAALGFAVGDAREFLAVLREVRAAPLLLALLLTVVSYSLFHATVLAYARASGTRLPAWRSFPATWVSHAVNNLVSSGGVGGTTIRVIGYSRLGASPGAAAAVSVMATLAGDLVVVAGILTGLAIVAAQGRIPMTTLWWSGGGLVALIGGWIALHVSLRNPERRSAVNARFERIAVRIAARLGSRLGGGDAVASFRADASATIGIVLARPTSTLAPVACTVVDFVVRAAVLGSAFAAVGHPLPPSIVLTGFLIGIAAGAASLIPGGLGALEGTMGAVFVWMDVPLPVVAAAIVVFRFCFYVAPLPLALLFSRSVINGTNSGVSL